VLCPSERLPLVEGKYAGLAPEMAPTRTGGWNQL
jgi:hypothetical protein